MSEFGKNLLNGAEQALAYIRGDKKGSKTHEVKIAEQIDVRKIRGKLHMSRQQFSDEFGFSIRTIEKWERQPEAPARAYLTVIDKNPKLGRETLGVKNKRLPANEKLLGLLL